MVQGLPIPESSGLAQMQILGPISRPTEPESLSSHGLETCHRLTSGIPIFITEWEPLPKEVTSSSLTLVRSKLLRTVNIFMRWLTYKAKILHMASLRNPGRGQNLTFKHDFFFLKVWTQNVLLHVTDRDGWKPLEKSSPVFLCSRSWDKTAISLTSRNFLHQGDRQSDFPAGLFWLGYELP